MTKYNVNELLEKKKDIEKQLCEKVVNSNELTYTKETVFDFTNKANNRTFEQRKKVTLEEYNQDFNGLVNELAKIKAEILVFNATNLNGRLQDREKVRFRLARLQAIKAHLPKNPSKNRDVTREDQDGKTLEAVEKLLEPMFDVKDVEKQLNNLSAQERKLNTEIQKVNLNAQVEL